MEARERMAHPEDEGKKPRIVGEAKKRSKCLRLKTQQKRGSNLHI
jgi:hypothetical protein